MRFIREPAPGAAEPPIVPSGLADTVAPSAAAFEKLPRPDVVDAEAYGAALSGRRDRHLRDHIRTLHKHRWVVLGTFLTVLLSAAVYTFTVTPIYEASVQLLIEKESANIVNFKEAIEQEQSMDDYYQTQYRILQSRALARRTMHALGLWSHPQFTSAVAAPPPAKRVAAAPVTPVGGPSSGAEPAELPPSDESTVQSDAIDRFLRSLSVSPVRNSRLVEIRFASPDAVLSASIANGLARAYIDQDLESKFQASKDASDWLGAQLAEQRQRVELSEQAVQRYREQTDAVSLEDTQNIVVQKLADLNAAVTRAKTERIQKEAAYDQIRQLQNDRIAIDTFPAIVSNPFIQQQKGELGELQRQQAQFSDNFGPNHPEMKKLELAIQSAEAKIQGEVAKVVQAVGNDYQQSLAQERGLMSALEQQKRDALSLNRKGIAYGALVRDATSNRQIFDSLLQRTNETRISGELKLSNIRVVDPAEIPTSPVSPDVRSNLILAFLGGATLALCLGFFLEYLDDRIHSPEELKQYLGLPFLGLVPVLTNPVSENPLLVNSVATGFSESFRAVRTNLLFSSAEARGRSVMMTSTGPREGKTFVATNLAIALAQAGLRVLLVDADMRKPRVHTIFNKPLEPGLSNVITGKTNVSGAVYTTAVPGLWVMPGGEQAPNPADLLGSKRFKDFMVSMAQRFDWVLLDTPPMTVTDASVVAHLAAGVLFVVGADMTSRHAAGRAVEQLAYVRANVVGAVLNRVDLERNSYHYSHYYRRADHDYYQPAVNS